MSAGAVVQADIDAVLPEIEAVTGRKLDPVPRVRVASPYSLHEVVADEMTARFERLFPTMLPADARTTAFWSSDFETRALLGKYALEAGELYVAPSAVSATLKEAKIDVDPAAARRLVVAHELVHALQAQEIGDLYPASTVDGWAAENATWEGHAVWVTRQVAERLGLADVEGKLETVLAGDGGGSIGYRTAATFVTAYAAHDDVWTLLGHPPTTTLEVLRPDRYRAVAVETIDPERLAGAVIPFGTTGWMSKLDEDIGAAELSGQLPDDDASGPLLDGLVGGRRWEIADLHRRVQGWVYRFADEAGAQAAFEALERAGTTPPAGKTSLPTDQEVRDLPGLAEPAFHVRKRVTYNWPTTHLAQADVVAVRRGREVGIVRVDFAPKDELLVASVEGLMVSNP